MAKLIERVKLAHTELGPGVDRHWFRFHPYGWAGVYVDHWGILTIVSDWGSWAHAWGGGPETWGYPTFREFMKSTGPDYLADKLNYGRRREVPDPEATEKALKEHVHTLTMTPHETDELHRQIEKFCEGLEDSIDVAFLCIQWDCEELKEEFDCLHEWVQMKTAPKVVWLIEEFIPVFLAHLRGTLETITYEEWEERHGRKAAPQTAPEGP